MKIEKVEIKGLFGKKDICWELNPQVNVLVGANGSGKSTILSFIYCMLKDISLAKKGEIFKKISIYFDDEELLPITQYSYEIAPIILNKFLEMISTKMKDGTYKLNDLTEDEMHIVRDKLFKDIYNMKYLHNMSELERTLMRKMEETTDNFFDRFNITMISTLNLSANAIFEFKGSNEEVLNILDLEMDKVLNQFNYKSDNEMKERLINALNFFLNMVGKNVKYEENTILYFDTEIQKELRFSDLSSGERQLVYMLVQVALNSTEKEKSSIVLMDEPEISLHIDWQEYFIHQLRVLSPNTQFIIVTHNPALIMNGWNAVYKDIEEITQ